MNRSTPVLKFSRKVYVWLVIGLIMVYCQIIIGGITRLTGSGLSITEWEIVTGSFPPLSETEWQYEFEKYKLTPQYKKINRGMEMGSFFQPGTFKFIYFWEYIHRFWARVMGLVFLIPFLFFYFKGLLNRDLIKHLAVVILLSVLAATFGWIMVASGLIDRPWVNAYKLAIHLCIGVSVFLALLWSILNYNHPERRFYNFQRPKYLLPLAIILFLQIFLGGVMSGTKASLFFTTWPDYNGSGIPNEIIHLNNWNFFNFTNYEKSGFLVALIQFLHRNVAYILCVYALVILFKKGWFFVRNAEGRSYMLFFSLILIQIALGILTLLNSTGSIPIFYGVMHQGGAVLLAAAFVMHYYYLSYIEHEVRIA